MDSGRPSRPDAATPCLTFSHGVWSTVTNTNPCHFYREAA
ncbi:hypothetical protein ALO92_101571 [Pseudomonas congelans]|uniref:Uncharacterized protein n=1 Tax=Pseudomonas congelans TaxID=200452 RepID=A0A0P9M5B1_9PSED|nr:hypothetical protein ALO92_101571 [Pseudomonas congelans]